MVYHPIVIKDTLTYLSHDVVTSKNFNRKRKVYGRMPQDAMSSD